MALLNVDSTGTDPMLVALPAPQAPSLAQQVRACDQRLSELLFLDTAERGFWIAKRGSIALPFAKQDGHVDKLIDAASDHLRSRNDLLPTRR